MLGRLCVSALVVALSLPAAAATFSADEAFVAPGGDFSGGASPSNTNVGAATAGFSNVFGELAGDCVDNGFDCNPGTLATGDTQDSFQFTVETGFKLVGINVGTEGFGPDLLSISFSLAEFIPGFSTIQQVTSLINTSTSFGALDLAAGDYSFSVFGQSADMEGSYQAFWNVELEVEAIGDPNVIPLPAGFPLMLGGIVALGWMSRRKRA